MDILVVDHSIPVTAALCGLLAGVRQASLHTAASVGEAIERIGRDRPAAAIVNFRLPGGSVLDVLAHAKRVSPGTLVIVLGGDVGDAARAACLEAGADHFLDKHTQFNEAVRIVSALAQAAQAGRKGASA